MFAGYDTNKSDWHGYDPFYERIMADKKHSAEAIMELGILNGGSLKAFRDYFPNAEIIGYDINPETMVSGERRIYTFTGNTRDKKTLTAAAEKLGVKYDLIVDDASHIPIDIYHALKALWGFLKVGGYYVIEDVDVSKQADVITTVYILVGTKAEIHVFPGKQRRNGDLVALEKIR